MKISCFLSPPHLQTDHLNSNSIAYLGDQVPVRSPSWKESQRDLLVTFCKEAAQSSAMCGRDHTFPLQVNSGSLVPGIYPCHTSFFFPVRSFCHLRSLFSCFCFSRVCLSPLLSLGYAIHQPTLLVHSLSLFIFVHVLQLAQDLRRTQY